LAGAGRPFDLETTAHGIENKWFLLKGRVVAVKAETDVIYTLNFKMRLAINRESLLLKYRQNSRGVRFATSFLVGRLRDSLFTLALLGN
jgi:hypothetical protein